MLATWYQESHLLLQWRKSWYRENLFTSRGTHERMKYFQGLPEDRTPDPINTIPGTLLFTHNASSTDELGFFWHHVCSTITQILTWCSDPRYCCEIVRRYTGSWESISICLWIQWYSWRRASKSLGVTSVQFHVFPLFSSKRHYIGSSSFKENFTVGGSGLVTEEDVWKKQRPHDEQI